MRDKPHRKASRTTFYRGVMLEIMGTEIKGASMDKTSKTGINVHCYSQQKLLQRLEKTTPGVG